MNTTRANPATRFFPVIFVLLWSTGFVGAGLSMPYAEPFTFLTLRFALAIALLSAIAMWQGAPWPDWRGALSATLVGLLVHGVYLGGVFWAVHRGMPAGLSALITGLQPIMTAVFAGMLLGETVRRAQWVGLVAGLAGIDMVLAPKIAGGFAGVTAVTIFAASCSMLGMSLGTVVQKWLGARADLRTGAGWQFIGAGGVSTALAFAFETRVIGWAAQLLIALAWLTIVLSIGAIFLLMFMIREGEVSRVASLFYLVPGVTALMTWALFDETLQPVQIAGMLVTMAAVALATYQPRRTADRAMR